MKTITIPQELKASPGTNKDYEEYAQWVRYNSSNPVTQTVFETYMPSNCVHCGESNPRTRWVCRECCENEGLD